MDEQRTSSYMLLSSEHSRLRRAQRAIAKRDLQAAVKHGKWRREFPNPKTGEPRRIYTFAEVEFVTDETGTREITCWALPGAGLDVERVTITEEMKNAHVEACKMLMNPATWTSHTVVIVDQSGSMRQPDVVGGATRSDAVWLTLALDFVAAQLEKKVATATDVVSVVGMNDGATILLHAKPMDWQLFNDIIGLLRSQQPKADGNYLPVLDQAEQLLMRNTHGSSCSCSYLMESQATHVE